MPYYIIGIQTGTIILTTTHFAVLNYGNFARYTYGATTVPVDNATVPEQSFLHEHGDWVKARHCHHGRLGRPLGYLIFSLVALIRDPIY